jgi:DNA polymerase sigma
MANGLALDTSDMDVAVLGLSIQEKSEIIECMYEMEDPLLLSECVEQVKIIETATVPLIKLKVNL